MDIKTEWKRFFWMVLVFLTLFFLPIGNPDFNNAVLESFHLLKWYAREHVLLCLIPAFFIAGAISVFISKASVVKYLGVKANKIVAYTVASFSGTILAVCSCTILPLFSSIHKMGAGLGPAIAFLYSGPAINILAIILTGKILGLELGIARALGAIIFSIVIGLLMSLIFRNEQKNASDQEIEIFPSKTLERSLFQNALYFFSMIGILVFSNWAKPQENFGFWYNIFILKWQITVLFYLIFNFILWKWFKIKLQKIIFVLISVLAIYLIFPTNPIFSFVTGFIGLSLILHTENEENQKWGITSWNFAKQILPLLFFGVLVAGFLLGRPNTEGFIPKEWIINAVGGNSLGANLFASVAGAFMYFATLTEVPILQGLIANGMGKGPALALLLAGPALSLPNMLVIKSVIGIQKTVVFVSLVIIMATISGMLFGNF